MNHNSFMFITYPTGIRFPSSIPLLLTTADNLWVDSQIVVEFV